MDNALPLLVQTVSSAPVPSLYKPQLKGAVPAVRVWPFSRKQSIGPYTVIRLVLLVLCRAAQGKETMENIRLFLPAHGESLATSTDLCTPEKTR